jgi:broad specificity phosphatase PhoE
MLGDVLAGENLERIISSPLQRAVTTASEVARRAGLEVEVDPRFIDRDYGPWAGRPKDQVIARWGSLDDAPEIEPERAVLTRSMDGLDDASRHMSRGTLLVVSHDAVNRLLLTALDARLGEAETVPQDTGCFNVLQRRGDEWAVLSINNTPRPH